VSRIALIGSLTTTQAKPHDVDLLVTVDGDADRTQLAALGRKLKGHAVFGVGEQFGHTRFLAQVVGPVPQTAILRSVELLETVVAPAIRAALGAAQQHAPGTAS
jgi:hypothetical protein